MKIFFSFFVTIDNIFFFSYNSIILHQAHCPHCKTGVYEIQSVLANSSKNVFCKFGQSRKFDVKLAFHFYFKKVISSESVFGTINYCEIDNTFYCDDGFDKIFLAMFLILYRRCCILNKELIWDNNFIYVYCQKNISHQLSLTRLLIIFLEFILHNRQNETSKGILPFTKKRLFMESSLHKLLDSEIRNIYHTVQSTIWNIFSEFRFFV